MLHLANPKFLLLLLVIPPLIWRYVRGIRQGQGSLQFASTMALEGIRPSWTVYVRHILFGISMLALALAITAMARPQRFFRSAERR